MFQINSCGDSVLVAVSGELDEETLPKFDDLLKVVALDDLAGLIVDLRDCSYISSAGITAIIRLSRKYPGDFEVLVAPKGAVHRVFDICGFLKPETFVRIAPDDTFAADSNVA